jgi:TolA-binding protein
LRSLAPSRFAGALLACLVLSAPCLADENAANHVAPTEAVGNYLDAIELAEAQYSAYSIELADLYLGLGQSLLEREEYDGARKAFQQGMQIVRVNFGLNSTDQTPYLFSLADIESRVGNGAVADEMLQYIYLINARTVGDNHPDMLPVLDQMLSWYLQRIAPDYSPERYAGLTKAELITSKMAEIVELDKGLGHPDTAQLYRRAGQLNYYLIEYLSRMEAPRQTGSSFLSVGSAPNASRLDQQNPMVRYFREGTNAFTKFGDSVSQNENRTSLEQAEAIAQLGDWYLALSKPQAANKIYQQAYKVLAASKDSQQLIQSFFGQPTPLRFLNEEPYLSNMQDNDSANELEVSVTVTSSGRIRDIEILNLPENMEKDRLRKNIKKRLSGMRFRPRLDDGQPVDSEGFILRYAVQETEGQTR